MSSYKYLAHQLGLSRFHCCHLPGLPYPIANPLDKHYTEVHSHTHTHTLNLFSCALIRSKPTRLTLILRRHSMALDLSGCACLSSSFQFCRNEWNCKGCLDTVGGPIFCSACVSVLVDIMQPRGRSDILVLGAMRSPGPNQGCRTIDRVTQWRIPAVESSRFTPFKLICTSCWWLLLLL
jgi:hypothetical protein